MNYPKDQNEVIELMQAVSRLIIENYQLKDMIAELQNKKVTEEEQKTDA